MQPWDTSPLHAGFAQLNRGLYRPASPDEEAVKKELEDLQKQMAELQKQGRDFIRMQALSKQMAELDAKLASYELNVANSLWVEKSFPLMQPFKDALAVHHDTGGAYPVDFLQKAEQERQAINQWVEQQTKNYIKDLFPQGSITSDTRVVLANAIYFKGAWQEPFPVAATQQKDFHLTDGKTVKAPLMQHEKSKARYGAFIGNGQPFATPRFYDDNLKPTDYYPAADGFTAVELPYKGGQLSLLVIAPQKPEGLAALEKKLTADNLNDWLSKMGNRKIVVDLPKYKVESSFSLNGSLAKLGLGEAFAPGKANFQGISNAENLYISAAVHKAYVEVSEEGTVAAAATGLSFSTTSAPVQIPFVPHFRADRPFLFMIRDGSTGLVLFMGRVMNPAE